MRSWNVGNERLRIGIDVDLFVGAGFFLAENVLRSICPHVPIAAGNQALKF